MSNNVTSQMLEEIVSYIIEHNLLEACVTYTTTCDKLMVKEPFILFALLLNFISMIGNQSM